MASRLGGIEWPLMRVCILLLCCVVAAWGQSKPWLCGALLDRCDVIVQGRWVSDRLVSASVQLTVFKVERCFKGGKLSEVRVGGLGTRGAAYPELSKLLFLKGDPKSSVFAAVDLIDLTADDSVIGPVLVESTLRLAAQPNGPQLHETLRELSLSGVRSTSTFAQRAGLRELCRLSEMNAVCLQWEDAGTVHRAGASLPLEDRHIATALSQRIRKSVLGVCYGTETTVKEGDERDAWVRLLERTLRAHASRQPEFLGAFAARFAARGRSALEALLGATAGHLRQESALLLGDLGSEASVAKLLDIPAGAERSERSARIEAVGKLAGPESLDALVALLPQRDILDATLTAIARVDGLRGREVLERVLAQMRLLPEENARVELLNRLLTAAFLSAEALRRAARNAQRGG